RISSIRRIPQAAPFPYTTLFRSVGAQSAVLLAVDAHLALEGPAAVGEVQSRGARMLGLYARASLRYDDVAEHQRVGAVVDLGRGRIEVDRLVGGRRRRRRGVRG